jgi:hypothetical protein
MQLSDMERMSRVHQGLDIGMVASLLFDDTQVAGQPFFPLYKHCMEVTGTTAASWKVFRRVQRAYTFARSVEQCARLGAPMVECGVFRGFSGLLACHVLKALRPGYDGSGLFLVDSYAGLSQPGSEDNVARPVTGGGTRVAPSHGAGHFAVPLEQVKASLAPFPAVSFVRGWIPPILSSLPDQQWSFLHVDVDLYEPTLACLDYFVPRMVKGGIILNDDFSSPLFPGGGSSWAQYFESRNLPYAVLDTGQALFIKQ